MIVYDDSISIVILPLISHLFPMDLQEHIIDIIESGPTSQFYCKIVDNPPATHLYLVERNKFEEYILCHLFSFDQIGNDYLYQSLHAEHINSFNLFITQVSV
ncbi:hypothetical protein D3C76_261100 [compost metagenome]